jgi:hypothetical protein
MDSQVLWINLCITSTWTDGKRQGYDKCQTAFFLGIVFQIVTTPYLVSALVTCRFSSDSYRLGRFPRHPSVIDTGKTAL